MTRWRGALLLTMLAFVPGCFSASSARRADDSLTGLASWYGQEFAGRTTANGEIFDPQQLTAAHRTLPFGTILQVKNPKNDKTVQVRINDRGPFVGNRVIDLSYGAAAQLEMVNTGVAEVELKILKFGAGDREPPAPLVVKAGDPVRIAPSPVTRDSAPAIEFPLPPDIDNIASRQDTNPDPAVVEQIEVVEERAGQVLRKQVSGDGTTVTHAPDPNAPAPTRSSSEPRAEPRPLPAPTRFVAQLGAFSSAANANQLADRVRDIATNVYVEKFRDLHRVRVGPFASREAATEVKEKLDAAGIAAIVVPE
jgi:rare lipoprotein A